MSNIRLRRLAADFDKLQNYVRRHPRVKLLQFDGDPPERFQMEYRICSLRQVGNELVRIKSHIVEIVLPRNYPRTPPQCRMLSPVFHPNIAPHAICVGDHWSAGESLQAIVMRIGEMLAYQSYNVKSPLNGEAARWVAEHAEELPLDNVSLLVDERDEPEDDFNTNPFEIVEPPRSQPPVPPSNPVTQTPPTASPAPTIVQGEAEAKSATVAEKINTVCTQCGAKYRVAAIHKGRSVTCKGCGESFIIN
ncbi:MAG: ubiquitin-conjugating enzyme E2 [Planctomycetaceae bacterium]